MEVKIKLNVQIFKLVSAQAGKKELFALVVTSEWGLVDLFIRLVVHHSFAMVSKSHKTKGNKQPLSFSEILSDLSITHPKAHFSFPLGGEVFTRGKNRSRILFIHLFCG